PRSTLARLPPAAPLGASLRGTYSAKRSYTTWLPGCHSPFTNLYGPEPITSLTCSLASVDASRAGMMNGTLLDGLPSASSTGPNGSFRSSVNVFLSDAASLPVAASSSLPSESFCPQRCRDTTQ